MTSNTLLTPSERSSRIPEVCAGIAAGIAVLAIAGWLSGMRVLAGEWGTFVPMAPSTALAFLLLSSALYCFARGPRSQQSRLLALGSAGIACLVGLLVLGQFLTGVDLGVERVLSRTNEFLGSTPLGRMSPLTAFTFVLEGGAFFLLSEERWEKARVMAALLAAAATAINAVVLIGYAYGAPLLYGGTIIPMALPTGIAFWLVGIGLLILLLPGIRALSKWSSTSMRGMLLRAFMPFMLLFVLVDGWLDVRFEAVLTLNPALWNSLKSLLAGVLVVLITSWIARRSGREIEQAQKSLAESEDKFRGVFENSPLGISMTGVDGAMKVNQAFCDIVGYTEEELLAGSWRKITYPDDIQKSVDAHEALLEGSIARAHFEKRYVRKDGSVVWTDLTTGLQRDAAGLPLFFITTIKNISERKEADEALREREEKWRQLFAILPVGVSVLDPARAITETNPELQRILQLTSDGVQSRSYEGRQYIRADGSPMLPEELPSVRAVQEQRTVEHTEIGVVTEGGAITWTDVSAAPLPQSNGGCVVVTSDITERKQAEEALRKTQALLNDTQEIAHIGGWEYEVATGRVFWTDEVYRIHGLTRDYDPESAGRDILFYAPEDQKVIDEAFKRAIGEGTPYDLELQLRKANGEYIWVRTIGRAEHQDGKVVRVLGSIMDISKRKGAETALRESEERFRKIFEGSPIGTATVGADLHFVHANPTFCRMMGYTEEELPGLTFTNLTHADHITADIENVMKLFRGELDVYQTEKRYIRKNQETLWGTVTISPMRDEQGKFLYFLAMVEDITARKQAESIRRESDERYRSLFENMLNGFAYCQMIFDGKEPADFIYLDVNHAFESLTGLKDVTGRKVSDIIPGIRESNPELLEIYGSVARTGEPQHFETYVEPLQMWFSISVYCPRRGYFVAVFDVITDRKRAEAEIRELNAELEQRVIRRTDQLQAANKELEAFAYSVSHDLRAPLRAITGFTSILLEDYGPLLDAEGQRVCNVISREAQRMGRLIDDLLAFSRLNRKEKADSSIDMQSMMLSVFNELTTPQDRERIELRCGGIPVATGDPALIRQVWVNLLSNAIKFTSKKERALIQVECAQGPNETIYSVRDNGAGFDMRYADKLFGVFQRLHSENEFEGTGVGLAIVQRVVNRHGGRVWGEGKVDQGATFYFALPAQEAPDE